MLRRSLYIISILIVSMIFASCRIGHVHKTPEMDVPTQFDYNELDAGSVADIGWSSIYQDTTLQKLIKKALENNKDMLVAAARIKEMAANKRIKNADIYPGLGVSAGVDREYENYGGNSPGYSTEINATATIGWEADLWYNLRWKNEAAAAAYLQSVEAQRALHLSIVAQVAQMYFELTALDRELTIVRQTLDARREAVTFAQVRFEGGLTSEIPYRQSLVELARTEVLVPQLESSLKMKENDLSVLLGEFPHDIPRGNDISEISILKELPVDLPSDLLKRRPDVLEAELKLKEANALVGVALTDMFPKIRLTGTVGAENNELANFIKSPTWTLIGSLTGPLFNMGKNRAAHKAAQAAWEQECYRYEKKILEVFVEVNNAIVAFEKAREMHNSTEALYFSAKTYHNLARFQYVNGAISYIDVLDAQRQLFDAQIALNDAMLNELNATVSLYKSLGGGFIQ